MADCPLGIPNGWFMVLFSEDLAPGELKPIQLLQEELVAFRGESGSVHVLEAYCAHLGAHLAHGGCVQGDTVRCPFHGWRYDGDGRCVEIPYSKKIPKLAQMRSWPVDEVNGQIWVWRHAEGKPPSYRIPKIPEFGAPDWTSRWTRYSWELKTHPQEIMENAIDWPHFEQVHSMDVPSHKEHSFDGPMFKWVIDAGYENVVDGPSRRLFLVAENWGLGLCKIHYNGAFETLSVGTMTPIDRDTLWFSNAVIGRKGERSDEEAMADLKAQMDEQQNITNQDFRIWENKRYRPNPVLCDGDGPIPEFRRWARQFYSEEAGADTESAA